MDTTASSPVTPLAAACRRMGERAVSASRTLSQVLAGRRTAALMAAADAIDAGADTILAANQQDLRAGEQAGLSAAMLDRLQLDGPRIGKVADAVRQIAAQPDPVGRVVEGFERGDGLKLTKIRVPIGVVLMIFESRPNVTADAAALCIRSGNAVILRGGKEAAGSNAALAACMRRGLERADLPPDAVQLVDTPDRAAVGELLKLEGLIDLAIPRGGESLIRAVVEQARIPVIKHYTGLCTTYVHADADPDMAVSICVNAKAQRPGVCNATETFLVHRACAASGLLRRIADALTQRRVELRVHANAAAFIPQGTPATDADFHTEFLDLIAAVKVVDSLDEAIAHINTHGSKHTDAIITGSLTAGEAFVKRVDSGNVFINCSTRFSDGGEYGMGAEIGISTDKLHSRGPMGAADLTTTKWIAVGSGHVRG